MAKGNTFALSRRADIDALNLIGGVYNFHDSIKKGCDLISPNGSRVEIKASVVKTNQKSMKFSLNIEGEQLRKRADYLLCIAYKEDYSIAGYWVIPTKMLPDWNTSISITMNPQKKRHITWNKYQFSAEDVIKIFSTSKGENDAKIKISTR